MSGRQLLLSATALLCAGCAWSNPENRPVWNAFESTLVPDDATARVLTLPLTVPLGLCAVLTDTLIAHPLQVIDDAGVDAAEMWDDVDWQDRYYTEFGMLPLRMVGTPIVFAGSWLGRSIFNISPAKPPRDDDEPPAVAPDAAPDDATRRAAVLTFLEELARNGNPRPPVHELTTWDATLQAAFERARSSADVRGRRELYRVARMREFEPMRLQPWLGLRDPDPVVRHAELVKLARDVDVPEDLRRSLLEDPSESVRLVAAERWETPR